MFLIFFYWSKVAFHFSGLSGPTSQFLSGARKLSELVLARMAVLMDQSRSVLPLPSVKVGELSAKKMYARAIEMARTSSFRPARTDNEKRPKSLFGRGQGPTYKRASSPISSPLRRHKIR